jgi:hypothetical protein
MIYLLRRSTFVTLLAAILTASCPTGWADLSYENSSNGLPTAGQWMYNTRVGDLNCDGYMDIIRLRGHDDFNQEDQGFQIWLGDGAGNWTKTYIPNGNFGYGGTAIGDINNDGFLDAAYGVHHNRSHPLIGAWIGDGGTSFTESSDGLATDGEDYGMAPCDFGDFDNDGLLDLGVGSFGCCNGVRAYRNIDGGTRWESWSNGLPHNGQNPNFGDWLMWADINRDACLDIVAACDKGPIWLGDGDGNWTGEDFGLPFTWIWYGGCDIGDINNDGWLDIAFTRHIQSGGDWYVPAVYTFDGSGWTDASEGLPDNGNYPEVEFLPLAFGDLDNDGCLDLVSLEGYSTGQWPSYYDWSSIHAWLGDGTGRWSEIPVIDTDIPGWPESVTLADMDHNNYLDIIVSTSRDDYEPGVIRVYTNTYPASALDVMVREPAGGEVFAPGGVRVIGWTSAIPSGTATVTIEYSTTGDQGPWHTIIEGLLDSNYYQWRVPDVGTVDGFIRVAVHSGKDEVSATNPRPFTIRKSTQAPDPEPYCDGPLFGQPSGGFPGWVWFSIPLTPEDPDPIALLGFDCGGNLWHWDRYLKTAQVYLPPFVTWDLAVGEGYLLYLQGASETPAYFGYDPAFPYEAKLGRQGWTWIGMPSGEPFGYADGFMDLVQVEYPVGGDKRTAAQDRVSGDPWANWGWSFWDTYGQTARTFTPYAPFGSNTCHPWLGYRIWLNTGTALDEGDPDQVVLIWPLR